MTSRREFLLRLLAAPAVWPAVSWAQTGDAAKDHAAPYLKLQPFINAGGDAFPEEAAALRMRQAFNDAVKAKQLPKTAPGAEVRSVAPQGYRAVASDIEEAFYGQADDAQEGWRRWVDSLGEIRRVGFYPLPGEKLRYEVAGVQGDQRQYRTGVWHATWKDDQLTSLRPEEEHLASAPEPWFRDVTQAVFGNEHTFAEQLARGVPYWRARLDPALGIDIYGSNGIAVGDIDGDGVDEVFVCQPGGLPNRLFKFNERGEIADITAQWEVALLDDTSCALFLDLRNTGRQDLVVLRSSGPLLYINDGSRFELKRDAFRFATIPRGGFTGMAAADYDRDGKLDLYLCCYVYFQSEAQYTYPSPYHDAQNGPPNFLLANKLQGDGGGFFEDVTEATGLNENNNRFSFAPGWCDYNDDGWPDLYVANDFGRKNLYRNQNGRFHDVAAEAGVEDIGPGMSTSWFDYNGDGRPDLYVANMWSDAGQRVTASEKFAPAQGGVDEKEAYRRHTRGNSLYRNTGDGHFEDTTDAEHVAFGRWAWASGGHDFDNDGQPEIFVTCGMLTGDREPDLMGFFWRDVVAHSPVTAQPSAAYENGWNAINQFVREGNSWNGHEPNVLHARRGERYFDFSGVSGLDWADDSRAFAVVDFDGDGRPDLILKSRLGPQLRLLQNNCAAHRQAITFRLRGTKSNRDAIGARIRVDRQTKWLEAGSGYLSQHTKRISFGLDRASAAKTVEITWPSGEHQTFSDLAAGFIYDITEGQAALAKTAFRTPKALPSQPVATDNRPQLADTWFAQPIPLPEVHQGHVLLYLVDGTANFKPAHEKSVVIDLAHPATDRHSHWEIFRRYLFDWRTTLQFPFTLLLNAEGEAIKVYGAPPSAQAVRADVALSPKPAVARALPFAGAYVKEPHRDFYKWGAAYLWAGYPTQARPYLEAVLRQTPDNERVLLLLSQIHLQEGHLKEAERLSREALKLNEGYAEGWAALGDVLETREDPRGALDCYNRALLLKNDLFYALLNGARAADKLADEARAEEWSRRALSAKPDSAEAANRLGLSLAKTGRAAEAKSYFEQAIRQDRGYADAINNLGVLYVQSGKTQDAIAAFEYGTRTAPGDEVSYMNLGRLYARLGQYDKAREVMERLLEQKPDSAAAQKALEELNRR